MGLIVDGNNVMGSRPDGWWRDRPAAMQRLVDALGDLGEPLTVVFDGRERALDAAPQVDVRFAADADDAIAALAGPGDVVVTSDAGLGARVRAAGATVDGAGAFRRKLDGLRPS